MRRMHMYGVALVAALAAVGFAVTAGVGSSHREAPLSSLDPTGDDTADYAAVANQAIKSLPGGGKVFAGQREDPFFVDLGATFDGINLRNATGNAGGGKDDLAGYGVHSLVLQVPEAAVTRDGKSVAGA